MKEYLSTKEVAERVRTQLKTELKGWKFSVKVKSYSGGSSITLSLIAGTEQVVEGYRQSQTPWGEGLRLPYTDDEPFPGYAQLNQYQLLSEFEREQLNRLSNGTYLTAKGWEIMKKATTILDSYHRDDSDIQSDYFSCNFYMHIQIGQWDNPYQVKEAK